MGEGWFQGRTRLGLSSLPFSADCCLHGGPNRPHSMTASVQGWPGHFLTEQIWPSPPLSSSASPPPARVHGFSQNEKAALTGDKAGLQLPLGCPPAAQSGAWSLAG